VIVEMSDGLDDVRRAEWAAFGRRARHAHPRQHADMGEIERAKGARPLFATARTDDGVAGVALVSVRPLLPGGFLSAEAVCVRGPTFDDPAVGRALLATIVEHLARRHVGRLRVAPHWTYPDADAVASVLADMNFAPVDEARDPTGWVDLSRGEDEILASFSSGTRKEIRLADRRGVEVRPLATEFDAASAFDLFAARRRAKGLSPVRRSELDTTFREVWSTGDSGVLLGAMKDRRLLGALAVLRSSSLAHPSLYAVDPEAGRETSNLNVGAALWWRAFLWAKAQGCAHLDVEGNVLPLDPSHPRYEYENFKRRFRPAPMERLGEHALVLDPVVWTIARQASRAPHLARRVVASATRLFQRGPRGVSAVRPLFPSPGGAP
jgi:peptidoglycan pentaglycine glycine transferase (the first glycine)